MTRSIGDKDGNGGAAQLKDAAVGARWGSFDGAGCGVGDVYGDDRWLLRHRRAHARSKAIPFGWRYPGSDKRPRPVAGLISVSRLPQRVEHCCRYKVILRRSATARLISVRKKADKGRHRGLLTARNSRSFPLSWFDRQFDCHDSAVLHNPNRLDMPHSWTTHNEATNAGCLSLLSISKTSLTW